MRVIAGSARGRTLFSPSGSRVRPTADRVKEALFSSLFSRFGSFAGLAILDLFAGSGALGIEALSRGAATALFVDCHNDSLQLVQKNLELTGLTRSAELLRLDAVKALGVLAAENKRFDIVFADPPYAEKKITEQLLQFLADESLTTPAGVIVLETGNKTEIQLPGKMTLLNRKTYGDTAIWLLEMTA